MWSQGSFFLLMFASWITRTCWPITMRLQLTPSRRHCTSLFFSRNDTWHSLHGICFRSLYLGKASKTQVRRALNFRVRLPKDDWNSILSTSQAISISKHFATGSSWALDGCVLSQWDFFSDFDTPVAVSMLYDKQYQGSHISWRQYACLLFRSLEEGSRERSWGWMCWVEVDLELADSGLEFLVDKHRVGYKRFYQAFF